MSSTTTPSATSASPSATHTATGMSSNDPGNSQSRPLLFFVALGFGVVFTNLWIIVGVKYCFRYNQRARQLAALGEDGAEGLDLAAMPRPRRRREKKLMSMEEVNARFPLIKYKMWRAAREQEGLPATGGVNASASRAPSIKEGRGLERSSTEDGSPPHDKEVSVPLPTGSGEAPYTSDRKDFGASRDRMVEEGPSSPIAYEKMKDIVNPNQPGASLPTTDQHIATVEDEVDEDDPIRTAVPAEMLAESGDSCAICIDTLEDDDEVRGLSCGHAFHASCLDPWLTSRRACCPLCKADYYVPKPRPEGEPQREEMERPRLPMMSPAHTWAGGRYMFAQPRVVAPRRVLIAGSRFTVDSDRYGFPVLMRDTRASRRHGSQQQLTVPQPASQVEGQTPTQDQSSWLRNALTNHSRNVPRLPRIPGFGRRQEAETSPASIAQSSVTPAQMEAGVFRQQPQAL